MITADVDLGCIRQERMRNNTFGDSASLQAARTAEFRTLPIALDLPDEPVTWRRKIERFPFVPSDPSKRHEYSYEVQGLATRLQAAVGVSGGLDSTQTLMVAARALDRLGLYTLPGFATSAQTKNNAWALIRALGVRGAEIDIRPAARQMLVDLNHPFARGEAVYDITFENAQAGLRTDYLFRLANQNSGLVVGTGDLSELALGWCTYGVGDHMSHYNVNASVAKTLIQHLIRFVVGSGEVSQEVAGVLRLILETEISPELVPAGASGAIQSSEQAVGPFALQDFNLYYLTRYGFRPSKIAFLAHHAWGDFERARWPAGIQLAKRQTYSLVEIRHWLEVFLRRFLLTSSSGQHSRMVPRFRRVARCRRAVIGAHLQMQM